MAAQPEVRRASRKPSSPCSRRRRCRASARSAASSCRSRTAPASATRRSTRRPRRSLAKAAQAPELAGLFSSFQVNVPQLYADIDRTKARQLGVAGDRRVRDDADLSRLALCQRLQQVRPHLLGARAGRRAVPRPRRRHRPAQGALGHRRDGAAVGAAEGEAERRAGARHALQRLPRRRHQWRRRARLLVRPGAGRGRAHRRRDAAEGLRLRMDRTDLSGNPRRQLGDLGLPARDPAGVPGARRAVREPDPAARRSS